MKKLIKAIPVLSLVCISGFLYFDSNANENISKLITDMKASIAVSGADSDDKIKVGLNVDYDYDWSSEQFEIEKYEVTVRISKNNARLIGEKLPSSDEKKGFRSKKDLPNLLNNHWELAIDGESYDNWARYVNCNQNHCTVNVVKISSRTELPKLVTLTPKTDEAKNLGIHNVKVLHDDYYLSSINDNHLAFNPVDCIKRSPVECGYVGYDQVGVSAYGKLNHSDFKKSKIFGLGADGGVYILDRYARLIEKPMKEGEYLFLDENKIKKQKMTIMSVAYVSVIYNNNDNLITINSDLTYSELLEQIKDVNSYIEKKKIAFTPYGYKGESKGKLKEKAPKKSPIPTLSASSYLPHAVHDRGYITLNDHVYYPGFYISDEINNSVLERCRPEHSPGKKVCSPIKNIDVKTFKVINKTFAMDKNHVYFQGEIIEDLDPASFKLIKTNNKFIKGKVWSDGSSAYLWRKKISSFNNVFEHIVAEYYNIDGAVYNYFRGRLVFVTDKVSGFRGIKNERKKIDRFTQNLYLYATDGESIFQRSKKLINTDPGDIRLLDELVLISNDNVYYKGNLIEGVDPHTLVKLKSSGYKDKNRTYNGYMEVLGFGEE